MAKLLVVENEPALLGLLGTLLKGEHHEVTPAKSGEEAVAILEKQSFDLMLSDIRMGAMDGMELLRRAREMIPGMPVIMLTAYGTVSTAVDALKLGAFDYLTKPFKIDELLNTVRRALEYNRALQENAVLKAQLETRYRLGNIIAESASMQKVCEMVRRVGPTDATVLIAGESGTGKEIVAKAIHASSTRKDKLFLPVNCAALPEPLLESEMFGHVKGAFTGADSHKVGLFEAAEGGTIFLDEIGSMPIGIQGKLLRVLQEREVRRLGSNQYTPVNARVLAATNDDLKEKIQQGLFREDLYYRLSVISIDIAPLRERIEDILPIAFSLVRKEIPANERAPTLSQEVCEVLESYDWPGNVRQLENCIKHAITFGNRTEIRLEDLPPQVLNAPRKGRAAGKGVAAQNLENAESLKAFLREKEKEYLEQVLERMGGDKEATAQKLNISLATLYRKLPSSKDK
jgi:two-component system, NtrC family, response regulator PilR